MAGFNAAEAAQRLMMMDPRNQTPGMGSPAHTAPSVPGIAGTPGVGRAQPWTVQARQMIDLPPNFWSYDQPGNVMNLHDAQFLQQADPQIYNQYLQMWRNDQMIPAPGGMHLPTIPRAQGN